MLSSAFHRFGSVSLAVVHSITLNEKYIKRLNYQNVHGDFSPVVVYIMGAVPKNCSTFSFAVVLIDVLCAVLLGDHTGEANLVSLLGHDACG